MKRTCLAFVLLSIPAFGQTAAGDSSNAAADALKKRFSSIDLTKAPRPLRQLTGTVTPKVCAIPLLNAMPSDMHSKMPILGPKASDPPPPGDPGSHVPMPACEPGLFQNK